MVLLSFRGTACVLRLPACLRFSDNTAFATGDWLHTSSPYTKCCAADQGTVPPPHSRSMPARRATPCHGCSRHCGSSCIAMARWSHCQTPVDIDMLRAEPRHSAAGAKRWKLLKGHPHEHRPATWHTATELVPPKHTTRIQVAGEGCISGRAGNSMGRDPHCILFD